MNKEVIKKANELVELINNLSKHKDDLKNVLSGGGFENIGIVPTRPNIGTKYLRTTILPIPVDSFVTMYMLNLDKRIAELEKELEQL